MINAVAIDTETTLITPGEFSPKLVCTSWYSLRNGRSGVVSKMETTDLLGKMAASGVDIVGHNIAFDILATAEYDQSLYEMWHELLDSGRVKNTQLRQKMQDIEEGCYRGTEDEDGNFTAHGYSLADLAKRHLGLELDKTTWRTGYGELIDVPLQEWPAGALEYARLDAEATAKVYAAQATLDAEQEMVRTWFDYALYYISRVGLAVDINQIAQLEKSTKEQMRKLQWTLQESGYLRVANLRDLINGKAALPEWTINTGQVRESVETQLAKKKVDSPRLSDTGKVKIDKVNCRAAGTPALVKFAEYKELASVLNKDIIFLQEGAKAGCVQTRFDSMLATGRTSSSTPNTQNIRRFPGIRECFVPRPGHVYLDCDYGSAELHTLAQTCLDLFGQSRLAEVLNSGKDAHIMMGAQIAGMSYEELDGLIASGLKKPKEWRSMAKGPNYGFPGGMGPSKFVEYIEAQGGTWSAAVKVFKGVREWEAKRRHVRDERVKLDDRVFAAYCLKQVWQQTWPEMKQFFDYIHSQVEQKLPVKLTRSGRSRYTDRFTAACNYMFQGPASDGAALAGVALHKACYIDTTNILYGCRIVHFVHDQYIIEAPKEIAELALPEMIEIMKKEFDRIVPDVLISVEGDIKERWSK